MTKALIQIELYKKKQIMRLYKSDNQLVRGINNAFPGSGYIEIYENKLFLISATGLLAYSDNWHSD